MQSSNTSTDPGLVTIRARGAKKRFPGIFFNAWRSELLLLLFILPGIYITWLWWKE